MARRLSWRLLSSDDGVIGPGSSSPGEKWNWVRPAQGEEDKNELAIATKQGYAITVSSK